MLASPANIFLCHTSKDAWTSPCSGKWRTGLLRLVWIYDYHQGQGRSYCFMRKHPWEETECPGYLCKWPWHCSKVPTLTTQQDTHFRPCPTVVYGVQNKKRAEGWGCSPSGVGDPPASASPSSACPVLTGGTHDSVTTGVHPSLVKYIYSHQRWLYIAATVIVLLSNSFC